MSAARCPDGHDSTSADYCSVCGLAIDPTAAGDVAGAGDPSGLGSAPGMQQARCSNCGEPHAINDVFCENCGLDFLTGSLPEPAAPVTSIGPVAAAPGGQSLIITADPAFHQRMDADDVLAFPDPAPAPRTVPITGARILVGRERPGRGIFPDVDLSSDPAASSRHALFERRADGTWTVTDLGSTNGTYVGDSMVPIPPDQPVPVTFGAAVHVGAWTRLELVEGPEVA